MLPIHIRLLILGIFLPLTLSARAELQMNGLSVHEELGQPLFIGAIYSSTTQLSATQLLEYDGKRRMELRIIAPRLSHRRLNKLWVEGAAINSSRETLISEARHMARFTNLFKEPLRSGDQLSIANLNNNETTITLNDTQLGVIESPKFFNLILRTWIGRVPLSSGFRQSLLNNEEINPNLKAQFVTTEPTADRKEKIASWIAPAIAQPPAINIQVAEPVLEEIATPQPETEKTATVAPQKPEQKTKRNKQNITTSKSRKLAEQARKQQLAEQLAAEEKAAEILLNRQLYQSELLRHTYKNIRYPSRAVERGQQGSVRVEITINRDGELEAMQEIESSKHSLLNKAAKRSIERASPYPPIPEALDDDQFTITLPIVFKLE